VRRSRAVEDSDLLKTALDAILPLFSDSKLWIRYGAGRSPRPAFSGPHSGARDSIHAAQCLRQLTRAAPSQAATWIRILPRCRTPGLACCPPPVVFTHRNARPRASVFFISLTELDPDGPLGGQAPAALPRILPWPSLC
jgi:hypothetical protein